MKNKKQMLKNSAISKAKDGPVNGVLCHSSKGQGESTLEIRRFYF